MVTNAEQEPVEPGKVEQAADAAEGLLRAAIAGDRYGAIRRIVLYCVVAGTLAFTVLPWVGFVGLLALTLLIASDRIV